MLLTNYHTHTPRCKHASGSEAAYLETALKNGFDTIGFTDHMAWPYPNGFSSPIRMDAELLPDYAAGVKKAKEIYGDRIKVHLGAECEYYPKYLTWLQEEKEKLGLEYLILGVHYPPYEEGFPQFASAKTPDEIKQYTELCIAGMETGLFSCLCHPDLPLKSYPEFDKHAEEMSRALSAAAAKLNIPLEYNLAGVRLRSVSSGFGYTSDEFWKIAAEYHCNAVIAYDAHEPEVLNDTASFKTAYDKLTALGITVLDRMPGL